MKILSTTPVEDGFFMPGEFEKHRGTLLIWPVRPGSWPYGGAEAQESFIQIAWELAETEKVWLFAGADAMADARRKTEAGFQRLAEEGGVPQEEADRRLAEICFAVLPTDDAWARDIGPSCVVRDEKGRREVRAVSWKFNAWGGVVDGLYADYEKDDAAAGEVSRLLELDLYDAGEFVLEGGAIHSDGEGTVVVTEACLLSEGRNPALKKAEIEDRLRIYLSAEKVIWLPHGIYNDETNEHVDNVFAFVRPGEAVLAWCSDTSDPQYRMSEADLRVLECETDAKGRKIRVHRLPIPKQAVCIGEKELAGLHFAEGEDMREAGERLAASYVNFYIANNKVLVPQFGDDNDAEAVRILGGLFPERRVVGIPARAIIVGGGNIHCVTQQIPAGDNI